MASLISVPDSGYGNDYIDVLVGCNYKWDVKSGPLTYSFGAAGQLSDWRPTFAWTDAEKSMFRTIFQSYAAVCGLQLVETNDATHATLVEWKVGQAWYLGMHEVPDNGSLTQLNGTFNTAAESWAATPGSDGWNTTIHELGHALGLNHPHSLGWGEDEDPHTFPGIDDFDPSDLGDYDLNQGIFTVMSYNVGWTGEPTDRVAGYGKAITPMAFDVAALQALYGANLSWKTGNDVYQLPTANIVGTGWSCIWDAGGVDTISNAGSAAACTINLLDAPLVGEHAGGYISWNRGIAGGYTIAKGAVIENAQGGSGNDAIIGNAANNDLQGGAGDDTITGGLGDDTMGGGSGNDMIDAGDGDDQVLFDHSRASYAVSFADGSFTVTSAEGVATLRNVERFYFSDAALLADTIATYQANGSISVSGTPTQGQTLRASSSLVDPLDPRTVSFQWLRDGELIDEATGDAYTLKQADVGKAITVEAAYSTARGVNDTFISAATAAVGNINDVPRGRVTISGNTTEYQTLTAVNEWTDLDGIGQISWQWLRANNVIADATAASYQLTQADVGQAISVRASYIDGGQTTESLTSAVTQAIVNINDEVSGTLVINGAAKQGETLSAINTFADRDGLGVLHYQWFRAGSFIRGAELGTYVLSQEDVGKAVSVRASYIDGGGTVESVTSAAIGAVANVNDTPLGSVTIYGKARQGQTLWAENSVTDADGLGAISYQWRVNGVNVSGATKPYFVLNAAHVHATISVVASYIDGFGMREKVASAATPEVTASETVMRTNVYGGSAYHEWVTGTSGNDSIMGLGGDDTLVGNAGNDTIKAGTGRDAVDGGDGNDLIVQEFVGSDTLVGGDGADTVDYSAYVATGARPWFELRAGWIEKYQDGEMVGKDKISGIEALTGTRYDDIISGSERAELLGGGAGNDVISGSDGNDTLNGGDGNDQLVGDGGDDMLNGGAGDDFLYAFGGSDVMNGGAGDDTLGDAGGRHAYILEGSFGRDTLMAIEHRSNSDDGGVVQFRGMTSANLLFQRSGDDLKITVAGKTDSLTIVEWYDEARDAAGWFHLQVDSFQVGNAILAGSVVEDLVTVIGAPPVSMASLLAA
jgi:Ca2+-binding RTX toxin-like protein